ncbi:hypothetical protein AAMO2058_000374800 [Amorphochlora amoebiformis]
MLSAASKARGSLLRLHSTEMNRSFIQAKMFSSSAISRPRIMLKLGTAVVTRSDECGIALGRLASIVEQVAELHSRGNDVIMVTSGAIGYGKQRLANRTGMGLLAQPSVEESKWAAIKPQAYAAHGQSGLMSLYEIMFRQYGLSTAQILLHAQDLEEGPRRERLAATMDDLLHMQTVIPIVNENDAIVVPEAQQGGDLRGILSISDNDSIAAVAAAEMKVKRLVLLSDVDGVYTGEPTNGGVLIPRISKGQCQEVMDKISFDSQTTRVGRGGMMSKVKAAMYAQEKGVEVVIANGFNENCLLGAAKSQVSHGTFFDTKNGEGALFGNAEEDIKSQAKKARDGGRALAQASPETRSKILNRLAALLIERKEEILSENSKDIEEHKGKLAQTLLDRLKLSEPKLESLAQGLNQLAKEDPLDKTLSKMKIAEGLTLVKKTVPIGVLLIIFESRPDALPQIAGLSIASGNALLLKGGKEAQRSNAILHSLVQEAIASECRDAIHSCHLVSGRDEVSSLLKMADVIDLCIPRGSNDLVQHIQNNTKIPVMGHADGICHVYVDTDCDLEMAINIIRDSKTDYPAACNAMETLLIHKNLVDDKRLVSILDSLKEAGVVVNVGKRLANMGLTEVQGLATTNNYHVEYGCLECTVEVVDDVKDAVSHIQANGSEHTEVVITQDEKIADFFSKAVDSACVFHNSSSRFSDGFRFGLGAEVGISTARIHARGPVGIDGLLTAKWVLDGQGHTVADFSTGKYEYVHEKQV